MKPTISVIIPTYNRSEKLHNSIESVIKQSFTDFELLVIDDSSSHEFNILNQNVIKAFGDDRIKYSKNKLKKGVAGARNTGIKLSQASIIAGLDDDDFWISKDKLKDQHKLLKNDIGMVGTSIKMINTITHKEIDYHYPESHSSLIEQIIVECPIWSSSILYQKKIAETIGGYRSWTLGEDYDFLLRFLKKSKVVSIPEPITAYCIHNNSLSHKVALKSQIYNIGIATTAGYGYPYYFQGICDRISALNLTKRNRGKLKSIVLG